ncbi:MAG: DNA polymerase IV [Coriobacteriia bacterium]|nr:DNA polymerase IV [Coriobacteriia bacterium]
MTIFGGGTPSSLVPWSGPAILLVDLDAFFASVEQMDHPEWKGQPVIVGGPSSERGVVSTASYEARRFGVHSAMPSAQAERMCPQAIWVRGNHARYKEVSQTIMGILGDETPHLQQVSIDEAFLDVSTTRHNTEHPYNVAARIQQRVRTEVGVTCSVGIGSTKTVAKVASDREKPSGLTCVMPGSEQAFLAPLPIRALSGVGAASEAELRKFGIQTLGQLAQAEESLLKRVFGKNAGLMRQRALGGEQSPVAADRTVKSVSHETSFAQDITCREDVRAAIATMATGVGRRLRKKGLAGTTVSLKLRLGDRQIKQAQTTLDAPTNNERAFTGLLYDLLDQVWAEGTPVRLVGVGVSNFEAPGAQLNLFANEAAGQRDHNLLTAADAIKDKFGESALTFGHEWRTKGK